MSLIEDFISRYIREYDFYSQVARLTAQMLERDLRTSGIRCIVTHRAKDVSRLAEKCRQRESQKGYGSIDDIYQDVVDLAGVRVALYFPGEQEQVDKVINRLFRLTEPRKDFPASSQGGSGRRFSGYSAAHYRVRLNGGNLSESDRRYASARVEIQVASVLMHAWSEVEHDLIYKPLEGDLSDQEISILDQLNGLVIAGEMALQMLQKAGEVRVAGTGRSFLNHYELAAHLLGRASDFLGGPVEGSGLGRVDLLFDLLTRLKLATPAQLDPYLESLHGNLEKRPLAEQVIDAMLLEDSTRYEVFNSLNSESREPVGMNGRGADSGRSERIVEFLETWVRLEEALRSFVPPGGQSSRMPLMAMLDYAPNVDDGTKAELHNLRLIRNDIVHGRKVISGGYLQEALNRLIVIEDLIQRQVRSRREG